MDILEVTAVLYVVIFFKSSKMSLPILVNKLFNSEIIFIFRRGNTHLLINKTTGRDFRKSIKFT